MDVLEKSGLSFGSGAEMQSTAPFARGAIRQQVFGGDTKIAAGKQKYMQMLSKIAAMDQKLGSLYGDPSSPLFIEHALKRERAKAGPATTGYKAAGDIQEEITRQEKELEGTIDEALSLYKQLTTQKVREEKVIEKETKKKETKKKKKAQITLGGEKVTTEQQKNLNRAGITDEKAKSEFIFKSPPAFQKFMIDEIIDGKIKKGSLNDARKIKDRRQKWEAEKKKVSAKGKKQRKTVF